LSSTPALAEPLPVEPGADGGGNGLVFLSVERADGSRETRALHCPDGTGHTRGTAACAQLAQAGGDFTALPPADGMCTKEYAPVTFRAAGFWDGAFRYYERDFANHCTGLLATGGAVFDLS
jgi:hypothetical protein